MALTKVPYVEKETIIHADNLNAIQDEIIANGEIIAQLQQDVGQAQSAAAASSETATDALANEASTFDSTKNYAAGEYVEYSNTLYRFKSDHAAGAWSGSDAVAVNVGSELTVISGSIDTISKMVLKEVDSPAPWSLGNWTTSSGTSGSDNKRIRVRTISNLNYVVDCETGILCQPLFWNGSSYVTQSEYKWYSNVDIKKIAPNNATSFRLNVKTDPETNLTDVVDTTAAKVHFLVSNVTDAISETVVFEDQGANAIRYSNGNVYSSDTYNHTGYVNIKKYKSIKYAKVRTSASSSNVGMAYYDGNYTFVSGEAAITNSSAASYFITESIVPQNAVYARFSLFADDSIGDFSIQGIFGIDSIENEIDTLASELPINENAVSITGSIDTLTVHGITLTRISGSQFTLSGTSTATSSQINVFSIFNGNHSTIGTAASGSDFVKNITKPGKYQIVHSGNITFAVTASNFGNRVQLNSGDTFTVVEESPVCLFIVSPRTQSYAEPISCEVYVYYEEDRKSKATAVDYIARDNIAAISEEINTSTSFPHKIIPLWGINDILANARQFSDVKYTPVKNLPKCSSTAVQSEDNVFPAGTEITGLPYSSTRAVDKMVGLNVSLRTFLSAITNPRSVLYTRRLTTPNANTYYGTVCSAYADWCYQYLHNLTSSEMYDWDQMEDIGYVGFQPGDCLVTRLYAHVVLITDVDIDEYGRVKKVYTVEAVHPRIRTKSYTYDAFVSEFTSKSYRLRRYNHRGQVGYNAVPYVKGFPDEEDGVVVFPDIMCEFGDGAVYGEGEDAVINVIDSTGYSLITVKKDGETVSTSSTIEDFTISNVSAGLYTVEMSSVDKETSTEFFVVNYTCSYDSETHIVTFESENAKPVAVHVYTSTPNVRLIELTDADRLAGELDVSDYITESYQYVKVTFATDYGTFTWYSYDLHQWVPFDAD